MIAQTYEDLYDKLGRKQRLEFMQKIDGETERIKQIVNNLLDFGKPKEPTPRQVEVNSLVKKTLQLVQNNLNIYNIETTTDLADDLPPIFVDDNQVVQVLVNLVLNAAQAMSEGGELHITTRMNEEEKMEEIIVRDTGKGIPPEYLPYVFDPFFSTKEEGGTGLGLSVSYGIVKNHGGNMWVESKVGVGTTFTVQLPITAKEEGEN